MHSNKYVICNCAIEITSAEKLAPEGDFTKFLGDFNEPDYSFQVLRTSVLPKKTGESVFVSPGLSVYKNGYEWWFSAYPVSISDYFTFACREGYEMLHLLSNQRFTEHPVFLGLHLPQLLLKKGIGLLHCSFIEHEGQAILFAGHKQVGKSTQAGFWEKYASATVINGDRAGVFFKDGVAFAGGVPYCGTSKICKNVQLPIKAIVCLSKGTENTLKRLSGFEAFTSLLGKFTYNTWDADDVNRISDLLTLLVGNVPVYSYSCVKDESAVEFLKTNLERMA